MIRIEKVKLENARPYDLCQIQPQSHLNVIVGQNGTGKTTVLEAIYIALTGKSFKTSRLKEFIQKDKDYCKIQIHLSEDESRQVLIKARSKELLKNANKVRSLSDFCKDIACISLIPEDIAMINGSSQYRRSYLDHMLFYQDAAHASCLQNYKKALSQKNSLLKAQLSLKNYLDQVAPWHQQMIELNDQIRKHRLALLADIKPWIEDYYTSISDGKGLLTLHYQANEDNFAQSLEQKAGLEHALTRTLLGCHKDDVHLMLNEKILSSYASQGEKSSALLALKFAELSFIQNIQHNIILLLDDIGGTLDEQRRKILLDRLNEQKYQTFITTADKNIESLSQALGATIYKQASVESSFPEYSVKSQLWKSEK
ncbi:DNA replication and repair protein RecF [bacterium]|nr:DNA replication and repair protein RecF [bacterium]